MESTLRFFVLIIGTEILNRRRQDAHFAFVSQALARYGHRLVGSFIIEDDPKLITDTIAFIASQPHSVLLSFGGIGSTPDDHTRRCAANALTNGKMEQNAQAKAVIKATLGEQAYPHPIKMAELPVGAKLLDNPVNNMPAFYLKDRYFFMPGFPEMSHPMVEHILRFILPKGKTIHRYTLTARCKENIFIELMEQTPAGVEVSSLPKLDDGDGWAVTLSVASHDKQAALATFQRYVALLDAQGIDYRLTDDA